MLWILRRLKSQRFDGYHAFLVRADSEQDARLLADSYGSAEPRGIWVDPGMADCRQVTEAGESGILIAAGDET
ncbi:MAG: hypothetical protein ACYDGR_14425 [Candidatus Dormibacteria bacterium]